jgi:hypothetical protein
MAGTPKLLAQFKPTNSNSTLATVTSGKRWIISMIHASNTDTVQRTLRLNHVKNGESVDVKNRVVPDSALPAGDFMEFFGGAILTDGDTIQGLSDATSIIGVSVYGIEESL